ncbi:MAG TPA: DegQ family serine endoprotease [Pyrinomonadaceae bacterium]|nr:DegQ family serine endoprotease [Pyrinomonadaceae bacterium]
MLKKSHLLSIILISCFAIFLNGCKTTALESGNDPNQPVENKPQIPPSPILADGSRTSYADIVDRVAPAVVKVNVEVKAKPGKQGGSFEDFFKGLPQAPQEQRPQLERGIGSGVIVSADGTILTNNHVVDGATKIKIEMNDKRVLDAKVIGLDQLTDLAVLKVDAKDLPYLNLGDSDKVRVGDIILAIGNPLGIGQTVTAGIISAKGRRTGLSDGSFEDFLQIDAPINRGNSGGALVSLNGELIGINSQILSPSGGNIGIGFSIPSNMAKSVMEQLLKDGKVKRGQLGVGIQSITDELAKNLDLKDNKGVIVGSVKPGSSADKAGVKRGDIIVAINGEKVEDGNSLRNKVAQTAPGTEIKLTVLRDGKEVELKATLDEYTPETAQKDGGEGNKESNNKSAESGKLGLDLQPITPEIAKKLELPPDTKGLVVTDVDPEGPAAAEGIIKGDVILEINRQPIEKFEDVQSALEKSGEKPALLLVSRGGRTVFVPVEPKK